MQRNPPLRTPDPQTVQLESIDFTQVDRYDVWLRSKRYAPPAENRKKYIERAITPVKVKNREIRSFAPFRLKYSALETIRFGQVIVIVALVLAWLGGLFFFGETTLISTLALLTSVYFGDLLLNFWYAVRTLQNSQEAHIDDGIVYALKNSPWPRYTILCPLYHETAIVPQFVKAMAELDYPTDRLQILFLTEDDDAATRQAILHMHLPAYFEVVTVPNGQPRTKPRACNYGLLRATGEYVVIYDAEDIPDPLQLKKAVLTFANSPANVACVQAKLNFYNMTQNLLTRWFTADYSLWFNLTLPGLQRARLALPLGGTSNHFRMDVLLALGAWDPFNVTEDCDLGLRLARQQLHTVMLDSTTYEEANPRVKNWLRQRSRWIKGYMQTYLVHMRSPWHYLRRWRIREFFSLQYVVGGKILLLLVNPLMWALLLIYFLFQAVVTPYFHLLYPTPILYIAACCLFFGNCFYIFTCLIGTTKPGQYGLLLGTLFIPIYWLLMSAAAYIALYQLITKPHYWEKTEHGLHLKPGSVDAEFPSFKAVDLARTHILPASTAGNLRLQEYRPAKTLTAITTITEAVKATIIPPRTTLVRDDHRHTWISFVFADGWLLTTATLASILSIGAMVYSFRHHWVLLYNDSYSHLVIARGVFDSVTPGIVQLGGVWLPFPHLIMLPFIWNDFLWRSGLAGSIPAMIAYIVAAVYIFLVARRFTHDNGASFIGTLIFMLNPNILYLQTTPLTELPLIALMTMVGYYYLVWVQEDTLQQLVIAASVTFVMTLTRYDGWPLFLILLVGIIPIGFFKHQSRGQIVDTCILYGFLGGLGIALWLVWCALFFGDPLYFQRGQYSSQAQQLSFLLNGKLYTYHNLGEALRYYTIGSIEALGPILFAAGIFAVVVFIARHRFSAETFVGLTFLTPFAFYVTALYGGQAILYVPHAVPITEFHQFFNARYTAQMIAPAAIFLATLVGNWHPRILASFGRLALVSIVCAQTILTSQGGVLALQDGLSGASCAPAFATTAYLIEHYNGGYILKDLASDPKDIISAPIDQQNVINSGSGMVWKAAVKDPASYVDWVFLTAGDQVSHYVNSEDPTFLSQFTLATRDDRLRVLLFHRSSATLASRPLPSAYLHDHRICTITIDGQNISPP